MLPHPGFGEADAHVTLSTGIMGVTIAFHDDIDVTQWLLYSNPAIYAGAGCARARGTCSPRTAAWSPRTPCKR